MELELYLKSYFGLKQDDLRQIITLFKQTELPKGAYFLKTGKQSDKLSFVKSGLLRIYNTSDDGKEVTQWISSQGYFVTDLASFVFDTPARWTIQALTNVELFTITKTEYKAIEKIVPKWHELEKLFIARCFVILEDRIYSHLSMSAEERYKFFFEKNYELFNQVPLQYIASMLGMAPETFSRVRKKYAKLNS